MNKTVLLIPDLHHKWEQAEKIIASIGADEIIFLGDYLDDFNDTLAMMRNTCEWLVDSVKKPNRIHLAGNHEMSYWYDHCRCSGHTELKSFVVRDLIKKETWDALKHYHILDDKWLLSHSGIHPKHLPKQIKSSKNILNLTGEYLEKEIYQGYRNNSWIFKAGRARGGFQPVGGITWLDYNHEFHPIVGLNQIVGHTPQNSIPHWFVRDAEGHLTRARSDDYVPSISDINDPTKSHNLCLDVWGNLHYAVWNGETLAIGNYRDL